MNSFESNEFLHLHKIYAGFKTKKKARVEIEKAIKKDSVFKQSNVKKTSNAKKTTPHKLEKQFDDLCRTHLDKKRNGFIARKKALKAK